LAKDVLIPEAFKSGLPKKEIQKKRNVKTVRGGGRCLRKRENARLVTKSVVR